MMDIQEYQDYRVNLVVKEPKESPSTSPGAPLNRGVTLASQVWMGFLVRWVFLDPLVLRVSEVQLEFQGGRVYRDLEV